VCIVVADTVKVFEAGSSLDLVFQYAMESGLTVQWSFNNNIFAEYSSEQNYTLLESQFRRRLKEDYDRVKVTVHDLQPQDSGTYSVASFSIAGQKHPTQSFTVHIQ
ncbi:SLAM family member 8-like, partial [Clarias magur]